MARQAGHAPLRVHHRRPDELYAAVHGGDSDEARDSLFEYACHEGNYGMRNMLSGARIEEGQMSERGHRARRGSPEACQP